MTIEEAGKRLSIEEHVLRKYEEQGLLNLGDLNGDNLEKELQDIRLIDSLLRIGVGSEELKRLKNLMLQGAGTKKEQIRLLRKCRFEILDEIHLKQQVLDRMDYLIYSMKQE